MSNVNGNNYDKGPTIEKINFRNSADSVRLSRAGDQFHYLWAARRCLYLLSPSTDLVAVTIEGVSSDESLGSTSGHGEESIDVAEYFRSESLSSCTKVIYYQLKHSTINVARPWRLNDLKKTFAGFAKRYSKFLEDASDPESQQVEFVFLTNRPVADWVHELLRRIKERKLESQDSRKLQQLKNYLSATDELVYEFIDRFRIEDTSDGYWEQRNILYEEVRSYLPGFDKNCSDQLWLLVTKKVLPESSNNPSIRREDVLRALNTDEQSLFPAPCLIESGINLFPRSQEKKFIDQILKNNAPPIIIHAEGGLGKSAIARRLTENLIVQATVVLYDCFGNGSYRNPTGARHTHDVALVQIANEFASAGLCEPLIPSRLASSLDYLKAFDYRLRQAICLLRADNPEAKIVIVVDAADNAQLAAEELGERTSFPQDLLRHQFPDGVVLVCLSRTHRVCKLTPPPEYVALELLPFEIDETARFLRNRFPSATDNDVAEFHQLSSQNPGVQALCLENTSSLGVALEFLGPEPTTVEETIQSLFENSIVRLMDQSPMAEASQIELLCEALAVLRPFVPIKALSLASGLTPEAIRSFVTDLGRPILVRADAVQFVDESSETWFRNKYKPAQARLSEIVAKLLPLSSNSSYVASALPQLMLETGEYENLVEMVLSETYLPSGNPIEKRQVSLYRLQFALKAALRDKRLKDAAKLALKAGSEAAGDDRQQLLIQENTNLVSKFLEEERLREIVAQNSFSTVWHGGHRVYEAGLLAGNPSTIPEARNTLRVAYKWLRNWALSDSEVKRKEEISEEDIAQLAWVTLNTDGAEVLISDLEIWKPQMVAYKAGLVLSRNLVDLGDFDRLDQISVASQNNIYLLLSTIEAQSSILRFPPREAIEAAVEGVRNQQILLGEFDNVRNGQEFFLPAVNSVAQAAIHYWPLSSIEISKILVPYIPQPRNYYLRNNPLVSRFAILRANCLKAKLANEEVNILDFATREVREELEKNSSPYGREAEVLLSDVGPTLMWHKLWVNVFLGEKSSDNIDDEIVLCLKEFDNHTRYRQSDNRHIVGEISRLWVEIIAHYDDVTTHISRFLQWRNGPGKHLFTPDLIQLIQISANVPKLHHLAFKFANETSELVREARMESEEKVNGYCKIARAIFVLSVQEANCYFDIAVEFAGKIGQEHLDYWTSIIELASIAAIPDRPRPDLAYRVSRASEVIYDFVARDKYFDWIGTVVAIAALCPASAMTILSRWRDRNFGQQRYILPAVVYELAELGVINPASLLAAKGFQHGYGYVDLLDQALKITTDKLLTHRMYSETVRYILVDGGSLSELDGLNEIGERNGWPTDQVSAALQMSRRREMHIEDKQDPLSDPNNPEKDWEFIFSNLNTASVNSLQSAYERFRSGEPPYYFSSFVSIFFEHVAVGQESKSLKALAVLPEMSLLKFRYLFEALPETWLLQESVKRTLSELVEDMCKRHFHEITKSRYYQPLPFEVIAKTTGISKNDIFKMVVNESARHPDLFGSQRLFTLVGLIATTLSSEEAQDVLDFGLSLLEIDMNDGDGDGQWKSELAPPTTVEASLAGYIWTCLASPEVTARWQAAHVVRLLCQYRSIDVLNALVDLAMGEEKNVFSDVSLPFYDLAAKQWLLIALLRSVQDGDGLPEGIVEFVKNYCQPSEKHFMLRGLAADVLLKLNECNHLNLDTTEIARLSAINHPKLPTIESDRYNRILSESYIEEKCTEVRYLFDYDISRYWFESLGKIFFYSTVEIEKRVLRVICEDWDLKEKCNWMEDPREKRGIYRGSTLHSHGSYPKTESLRFYYSYHSMMVVAGDLIDTAQPHQDPDYSNEVENWIQRHSLTRTDGKWLADRRDSKPNEWPDWKDTEEADEWSFSVTKSDLLGVLNYDEDSFTVWGRWNEVSGDREQHIFISSALVSRGTSRALLYALQTVINPMNYRIPSADDDLQIDTDQYQLHGWITVGSSELGIDEYDPWAGDINYPPLRPAEWFCDATRLYTDAERRTWSSYEELNGIVLRSWTWGRKSAEQEYESPESGNRLTANKAALLGSLKAQEKDLIVEVQIRREFRPGSFQYRSKCISDYLLPYSLILVMNPNGSIFTI